MEISQPGCIARVARFVNRLYRHGHRCGLSNEELIAEGLLGLAESNARFASSGGANRWTFASPRMKGRIMDAARKEARAWHRHTAALPAVTRPAAGIGCNRVWPETRPELDLFNSPVNAPLERRTVESTLTAREMSRLLGQCLQELPPRLRHMVVECGLKGRPAREVGREVGLTRGRSARSLQRGLEEIRRRLELEGYTLADFV